MQKAIVVLSSCLGFLLVISFAPKADKINWLSVEEMQAQYAHNPKPILIDVYTKWCGWCKVMDKDTYSNDSVANYINAHYYAVKLDAETKTAIIWREKQFQYNTRYKANDFAIYITGGQLSFPTLIFLPTIDDQPAPLAGYAKPSELEAPVKFFAEGAYKTESFVSYSKHFKANW